MNEIDDLNRRIDSIISEISDVIGTLEEEISTAVTFNQVKDIENIISSYKRRGSPIPEEFNKLKLKLLKEHEKAKELSSLYSNFLDSLKEITPSKNIQKIARAIDADSKMSQSPNRKAPNYEKPLGGKGNKNLEDYLIPVIKLMWKGYDHKEAFREVAKNLDVRYNTVSAQCTRTLGLKNTDDFVNKVRTKTIVAFLENKYPDQYRTIENNLKD